MTRLGVGQKTDKWMKYLDMKMLVVSWIKCDLNSLSNFNLFHPVSILWQIEHEIMGEVNPKGVDKIIWFTSHI